MRVAEIFQSIDGEVNLWGQGRPSTFVRLAGCNLSCKWCDTPQSKLPGEKMAVDDVYQKIVDLGCPKVTVTGGEPLVQYWETLALIDLLLDNDFYVSVETNGTFFPPPIYLQNRQLSWVFDYKLEFPDKMQSMAMQSIVSPIHWIKIVVEDEKKYRQAILIKDWLRRVGGCRASFAFSPAFGDPGLPPSELAYWLIRDKQWDVWLNVQLHKLIAVR